MSFFTVDKPTSIDHIQSRLMRLAAFFLFIYAISLTLAPAVRLHSWQVDYRWNHWIGFVVWLVGSALVHQQILRRMPQRDPYLFPIGALLSGWGLLTIWRLDTIMGARQTLWLAICLVVFTIGMRIPNLLPLLRRYKYLWLTSGLLLTALTFLLGTYPGGLGPRLWLGCCGVYFQPSEPLKLLLIIYLTAYLADRLPVSFNIMQLLTPTLIVIGFALILLVTQRDLGTASLFILIYTVVVYLASQRWRTLVVSLVGLLSAGALGYLLFDVVRIRVDAWINPWLDPAGRSYQIIQSIIAVAAGGIFGAGPGLGSPGVVPVAHSDFIFASIAEETGLFGVIALLLLFGLLVGRGFRTALLAENNYRRFLAAGITAYLAMQGIFIIGGNLRLLPLTGVTLPFVSYGGSSLLTSFVALLLLITVSNIDEEEEPAPLNNPTPYLLISGGLLLGLVSMGLAAGWWMVVREETLLARPENPRRVIADRYVPRGELLDRNNKPIASTNGVPGSYQRTYEYPPLSDTIGYNSPLYGQGGLEAGLDSYLRGLKGNPASLIWLDNLLYAQPPPGLNVRLSIDLSLQKTADSLMDGHKGALVLLNTKTGEILAMASHPNYDPNQLDKNWAKLVSDPNAPLLNRATQGQYPPGPALGPFIYAYLHSQGSQMPAPQSLSYHNAGQTWNCAVQSAAPANAAEWVMDGCPGPLAAAGQQIGAQGLQALFTSLGFYQMPNLPIAMPVPSQPDVQQAGLAAVGQANLVVTPLQMALAATTLSNNGIRPPVRLALAVQTPDTGWILLPDGEQTSTLLKNLPLSALDQLAPSGQPYWQTVALAHANQLTLTWYLAGTLPQGKGTPLTLAIALEEPDPQLAEQIGQSLLQSAQK